MSQEYACSHFSSCLGIDQRYETELPRHSPFELLNNVSSFVGSSNVWEILGSIETDFLKDPKKVILIGAIGEPASGKSVLLWQILNWLTQSNSPINLVASKEKREIRVNIIPWGDAVMVEPSGTWNVPNEKLEKMQLKKQVNNASKIFSFILENTLSKSADNADKYIDIIAFDTPSVTGAIVDNKEIGLIRANDVLCELIHKKGDFNNYSTLYDTPYIFGLAASQEVRLWNKHNRELFEKASNDEQKKEILVKRGMILNLKEGRERMFGIEDAKLSDVLSIENEVNDFIIKLINNGKITALPRDFFSEKNLELLQSASNRFTEDFLRAFKTWKGEDIRANLIGRELFPWLFNECLNIPYQNRAFLYNKTTLTRLTYHDLQNQHFPIREFYKNLFANIVSYLEKERNLK